MHFSAYAALCILLSASAQATPPVKPAKSGCGKKHAPGFNDDVDKHSIKSGGRTRTYAVNVPESYNDDPTKEWPLIIDYHGNKGTPAKQYNNSMYYKYPEGQGYLAVYPAGVQKHWEGPSYAVEGVSDLQFTTDLLAHLRENYCIDSNRIYASGKSNGGGFVDTLACSDHGDEFAAFAMAAAALYTDVDEKAVCPKRRAILEEHGEKDKTIPYHPEEPGSGGPLPDIMKWVKRWAKRDGCDPKKDRRVSGDEGGYEVTSYSCKGLEDVVTHYRVFELGHCWSDSDGENTDSKRDYCQDHSLDFTPVVLDFFSKWTLDTAPKNPGGL
ncbi:hypothetical protein AJ79_06667 [Helicocarpus griseus UAMH5409]|uniref:feruloyl esterase n=1 Tax=Helicocarpus griseus UAMH5409 TaxID=1447875 RepID=A0A2B7XBF9_9EURO|nr:hypothetical protein AJ79_06667 [Helicocarpus griseus UAMH5409]